MQFILNQNSIIGIVSTPSNIRTDTKRRKERKSAQKKMISLKTKVDQHGDCV